MVQRPEKNEKRQPRGVYFFFAASSSDFCKSENIQK
jgi:hypothetical protein